MGPTTPSYVHVFMRQVFAFATKMGDIPSNPFGYVDAPRRKAKPVNPLTPSEVIAISSSSGGIDVKTVSSILGHNNAAMTLNVYADPPSRPPSEAQVAAGALPAVKPPSPRAAAVDSSRSRDCDHGLQVLRLRRDEVGETVCGRDQERPRLRRDNNDLVIIREAQVEPGPPLWL